MQVINAYILSILSTERCVFVVNRGQSARYEARARGSKMREPVCREVHICDSVDIYLAAEPLNTPHSGLVIIARGEAGRAADTPGTQILLTQWRCVAAPLN